MCAEDFIAAGKIRSPTPSNIGIRIGMKGMNHKY